jgi:translation elongation factor P/translation initiation factor 5A
LEAEFLEEEEVVVVVVGNGSCSLVYMSVYNTGKGTAGYVTLVFSDAETCKNDNECCVGKDRREAENGRSPTFAV